MKFTGILCVFMILVMVFAPLLSLNSGKFVKKEETTKEVFLKKRQKLPEKISIYRTKTKKVQTLSLEEYTILSVCAEMSPEYEEQALMAQAVACRTYAVYMIEKGKYDKADISDDYTIHQGYIDKDALKNKWGNKFDKYYEKISSCVEKTIGSVITFDSEIIQPAFFALCAGKTENAVDIWGGDIKYLKSVISVGDELASELKSVVKFSAEAFKKCCEKLDGYANDNKEESQIKILERTGAGAVKKVCVGNKNYSGIDAQKAFELKSLNFTVEYTDGCYIFTVLGNGHGVGMSQYGANYMAKQGSNYEEILKHYYTGVEIEK